MKSFIFCSETIFLYILPFVDLLLANVCRRDSFTEWPGIHADGVVIHSVTEYMMFKSCQRLCRLFIDCVGFNVNWTDVDGNIDACVILSEKSEWLEPEVVRKERSFFGK